MIPTSGPESVIAAPSTPTRAPLLWWVLSYASFGVPQAAAPIAFSLLLLPLTGEANSGAAMILAMTTAQVLGAVPVARLGVRFRSVPFLRFLVAFRAVAFGGIALLAAVGGSFPLLIAAAALAGVVGGAAYGYQRALLNELVPPAGLPRALGLASTLNEIVFVLGPVLAALLGAVSPVAAVVVFAVLGAGPVLLLPTTVDVPRRTASGRRRGRLLTPPILLWLGCCVATTAAVAAIEIGAVALAVDLGLGAAWAFVLTVALCVASVGGGIWISVRNRALGHLAVRIAFGATALGSILVAAQMSLLLTVLGAVLIGAFLAPLGTHYSLALDRLAHPDRRTEVFALLRTASSVSVIVVSGLLTLVPLQSALLACAALVVIGAMVVNASLRHTDDRQRSDEHQGDDHGRDD